MEKKVYTVKIVGPAGLGIKTSGVLLSKILLAHGIDVSDYTEYPSLIRGGHNTYQLSFSEKGIGACYFEVDLLFSLKEGCWKEHVGEMKEGGVIFGEEGGKIAKGKFLKLPLGEMIEELGNPIVGNTVCLGVAAFIFGLDRDICEKVIREVLGEKKLGVNLKAFEMGYEYGRENCEGEVKKVGYRIKKENLELYDGSEAFGWGFIAGGGNFYAAYPMTPSSGVLHLMANKKREYEIKVELPEDEIAVANIGAGASFAGARAAVGTSGGGFALMNECVSFCGIAEIGLVYYVAQRVGPATGMPTWTAQGDLLYTVFSGHGEFVKVVLAPGDHEESFEFGWKALNLADNLQIPVVVLSDKYLAEGSSGVKKLEGREVEIDRGKLVGEEVKGKFNRYDMKFACGRSPRTIPGVKGGEFLANSYEHGEDGLSTEDADKVRKMMEKRMRKLKTALKYVPKPVLYGAKKPKRLIVSWGSCKGPILEAMEMLDDSELGFLHIKTLWPIDEMVEKVVEEACEVVVIEGNQLGQLSLLLKTQFNFNPDKRILKYDGRPFFPEEIYEQLK